MTDIWKEAILDHCILTHMPFYENEPRNTIDGLINWYVDVNRDPLVSSSAVDDLAIDKFVIEMRRKMDAARESGRSGWDDPKQCKISRLRDLMNLAVTDEDYISIANYAMMLYNRTITTQQEK